MHKPNAFLITLSPWQKTHNPKQRWSDILLEDITAAKFNKIRLTCSLYHDQDHILITIQNDKLKTATERSATEFGGSILSSVKTLLLRAICSSAALQAQTLFCVWSG